MFKSETKYTTYPLMAFCDKGDLLQKETFFDFNQNGSGDNGVVFMASFMKGISCSSFRHRPFGIELNIPLIGIHVFNGSEVIRNNIDTLLYKYNINPIEWTTAVLHGYDEHTHRFTEKGVSWTEYGIFFEPTMLAKDFFAELREWLKIHSHRSNIAFNEQQEKKMQLKLEKEKYIKEVSDIFASLK